MQLLGSQSSVLRPRSRALSTLPNRPVAGRHAHRPSSRVRCDSRDAVDVVAFSADDLQQEVVLPDVIDKLASNGHSNGHSNGSDKLTTNGHSNGHSNGNGSSSKAQYTVVSSTNGANHAAASNGNGSGNSNGHANGSNGKGSSSAAAPAADAPAVAAEAPTAAAPAPAAAVDVEALTAQATAAWSSCAAALQLPGQQLSSVTFDCGVSVAIHRSGGASPSASPTASLTSLDEAAEAADVPAAEYFVRVTIPPEFGRDCVLHWAVENWVLPSTACRPPNSKQVRVLAKLATHKQLANWASTGPSHGCTVGRGWDWVWLSYTVLTVRRTHGEDGNCI